MGVVRFKAGVVVGDPPTSAQVRILSVLDQFAKQNGVDITVTSGRDFHELPDPHAKGLAFDVSLKDSAQRDFTPGLVYALVTHAKNQLPPGEFTVLYEVRQIPTDQKLASLQPFVNPQATAPHVHIQTRKGLAEWPPVSRTS